MSPGVWGADPVELRALAKDMDKTAGQLSSILGALTAQINGASAWIGPDAEGFRQQWNTVHRTSMLGANSILIAAATALVRNAADQEHTSAADGPGWYGSGAPGGQNAPGAPGTPGNPVPGLTADQDSLLAQLLDNPALVATE